MHRVGSGPRDACYRPVVRAAHIRQAGEGARPAAAGRGSRSVRPVTQSRVGDSYFTSAVPPECSAALLFKGSPLRPDGSSDHAEAAYNVTGPLPYAESVDVYTNVLNVHDVVWNGFRDVSHCRGDAVGVSRAGRSTPMRLRYFATLSDGVLVWTMSNPRWTCDYGLAVVPHAVLVLSACGFKPGFPMAEWASKRRAQLDSQV